MTTLGDGYYKELRFDDSNPIYVVEGQTLVVNATAFCYQYVSSFDFTAECTTTTSESVTLAGVNSPPYGVVSFGVSGDFATANPPAINVGQTGNFGTVPVSFSISSSNLVGNQGNRIGQVTLRNYWSDSQMGITSTKTFYVIENSAFQVGVIVLTPSVTEGGSATIRFYRTAVPSQADLPIPLSYTLGGTATSPDYSGLSGTVTIPAGTNQVDVTFSALTDGLVEGPETITVTLNNDGFGIDAGHGTGTVTIIDNNPVVTIAATDPNASESGKSGLFTVTRTADPGNPLTVLYSISGTASNGVDYAYLSNTVVIPAGGLTANITVAPIYDLLVEGNESVILTLKTNGYVLGAATNATVTISDYDDGSRKAPVLSAGLAATARYGRFVRGTGFDPSYQSFLVAVDFQQGVPLDNTGGNGSTLFPGLSWSSLNHYNATNNSNNLTFQNPIAAFGSRVGGSPLYYQQNYTFGLYAGDPGPQYTNSSTYTNALRVLVYDPTSFALVGSNALTIPNISNTNEWATFLTNGYTKSLTAYGLTTTLSFDNPDWTWNVGSHTSNYLDVAYHLVHKASATNKYIYEVELAGGTDKGWMVKDGNGNRSWSRLYTLEFEDRPEWRALLLRQPQFFGTPMPPGLAGKSAEEFLTNGLPVTNVVVVTNSPTSYTSLDQSPELRTHPTLDQFVADMGNDPIALANYVLNEIELTDAIDYNDNGAVSETSINLGGVNRGALGVFLEGQGSPTEQCALLVYLLRKAGYSALYLFPPHNSLKMVDARLSKLLRMQIRNAVNAADDNGSPYTTNQLIPVNYPWVGLYLASESRWVHIFPWLKDTQVEEQFNLYDYMPAQYDNAFKWARAYMYGDTNILSLNPTDDSPLILYPKFIEKTLRETAPALSLDDLGVLAWNRRNYYARWSDFPVPTSVGSSNIAIESLGSSSIANVSPALTNIFNTVSVEISSLANTNTKVASGEMRLAELHNRRLVAWHTEVATNNHTLTLSLAAFRTNITAAKAFAAASLFNSTDTNAIVNLTTNVSLGGTDDSLKLTIVHKRHRSIPGTYSTNDFWTPYLGFSSSLAVTNVRFLRKGDLAAICCNVGRATRRMLDQHATEIWQMEKAGVAGTMDRYQGSVAYLMGMSFFEKLDEFNSLACRLHKVQPLANFSGGVALLRAKHDSSNQLPNGNVILVQPALDMVFQETAAVGNQTLHLDSGDDGYGPHARVFELGIACGSALEHNTLNHFFEKSDSVSTVRLLQLAQAASSNIVLLTRYNYLTEGEKIPAGATNKLKEADPIVWNAITNSFTSAYVSNNVMAFVTPGKIYNATRTYHGMGAMVFNPDNYLALIGDGFNGAYSPPLDDSTLDPANIPHVNLIVDQDNSATFETDPFVAASTVLTPNAVGTFDAPEMVHEITSTTTFTQPAYEAMDNFKLVNQDSATARQTLEADMLDTGAMDKGFKGNHEEYVMDPVNVITGEFYHNRVDLFVKGTMRLDVGCNYSSQNEFDSEFGYGWKLNYAPYVTVSKDTTNALVYSAEVDGSVIAYRRQTNSSGVQLPLWKPTVKDNPRLQNLTGSVGNLFNSTITRTTNSSVVTYTQRAPDGGVRIYTQRSFALTNGSTVINRTRPYLDTWQDNRGNYLKFTYGTNAAFTDWGKIRRIESSSGNFVGFKYDVYAHIIEAWTGDDKWLFCDYDEYGDLVGLHLPDASEINFEYQHQVLSTNSTRQVYSTHLLIREEKPDGRLLANDYDKERRVINQYATVGEDLRLLRNASFVYSNNFRFTNSFTNLITGYTLVTDYSTNTTRYKYTNSLVTLTADPLSRTTRQAWYAFGDTNTGAYPGSLKFTVDPRGLITQFLYDPSGNATNITVIGDITGAGNTNDVAVKTFAYNTNNLVINAVDAVANRTAYTYTNPISPFLRTSEELYAANGTAITVNVMDYYSVTNTVVVNNFLGALGLPHHLVRAANWSDEAATNDFSHDAHGFLTNEVRHTGAGDPDVVMNYFHNLRGELVQQTDAAGRNTLLSYDARGNIQSREVFDESGNRLSLEAWYYNENGELEWYDGPRSGAEDYVWFHRDGAGRVVEEDRMRSRGRQDGTGVESETGDSLFAVTFHEYDPFNNRVKTIDPRGHYQRMAYDAMGQMIGRRFYDGTAGTGTSPLATEGFAYEPGGLVARHTNALGGVTQTLYTWTGQPEFRSNADGSTNGWLYYLDGRPRREVQNNGAYTEITYDDANRRVLHSFYSAGSAVLATNLVAMDHRGNVIRRVDAGGFSYTNLFDGLDRVKVVCGPMITFTNAGHLGFPDPPPPMQAATTNYFDAAGIYTTSVNALGETNVTVKDALQRTTHFQVFDSTGVSVRVRDLVYAPDHQSFTIWEGTGGNSIPTVHFSDTDGQEVLTVRYPAYPSTSQAQFAWQGYDLAGNRTQLKECFSSNGVLLVFSTNLWTFDGLNRVSTATQGDGATTTNSFDAAGDLTEQVLPGNLRWRAGYNSAGQRTSHYNLGTDGSTVARLTTYAYYPAGQIFAGMLWTSTDGRGVICTNTYDDFLRLASLTRTGASAEQKITTSIQYEARGLATNITESFAATNTGPTTVIGHTYSAYSLLLNESVSVGGAILSSAAQGWDPALRRTTLTIGGTPSDFGYAFGWRADALLASTGVGQNGQIGVGSYTYTDAGLLLTRSVGSRTTSITSRDRAGRVLGLNATISGSTKLTETLTWRPDDLLATDTQARQDFTDNRAMAYADWTRRLTSEILNIDGSTGWTNTLVYDNGQSKGPGVLTKSGSGAGVSPGLWTASTDPLLRINIETNTAIRQTAQGRVNGPARLSVKLDGVLQPMVAISTTDSNWPVQWRANFEVAPGTHQLQATALLPNGVYGTNTIYSTNTVNLFTCATTNQTISDNFDGAGFLTNRVTKLGTNTVRTQTLTWDGKGRLYKVSERDNTQSGVDWSAVYDAFDRLLRTTEVVVTNGVALTSQPSTIDHFYDPEYEFLELGVNEAGHVSWKGLGPDMDGTYGGQNGTGGFEAIVPAPGVFCPLLADLQGNLLAIYDVTGSGLSWYPSRPTGYGSVPAYRPVPLGQVGPDLGAKYAYRNRAAGSIGLVYLGANWYDPIAGQLASPDVAGHASSPNLYAFCHGNPYAYWDADGRFGKPVESSGFSTAFGDIINHPYGRSVWSGGIGGYVPDEELGSMFGDPLRELKNEVAQSAVEGVEGVFNVPEIRQDWQELRHPDFTSGWGRAAFGTAVIGLPAHVIDAAANLIPGKALVEDAIKGGLKGVRRMFAKEAAEDIGKALAKEAVGGEKVLVRHYTDTGTRQLINESGQLRSGTYVTLPSEIPPRAGHLQIEKTLEISPGRGSTYIDVPTPVSNLRVPANGPTTSGGAWQRQLIEPTPVDPNLWRRPPGRPLGGS